MCQNRSQILFIFTISLPWYVQQRESGKGIWAVLAFFFLLNDLFKDQCLITDKKKRKEKNRRKSCWLFFLYKHLANKFASIFY